MSEDLVTIKRFTYVNESHVYEAGLVSENIFYYLKDKEMVSMDAFASNAIGGIKLQVRSAEVKRALLIIDEIDKNIKENEPPSELTVDKSKYKLILYDCPKCDSSKVYINQLHWFVDLFSSFSKRNHYCASCGYKWKQLKS